MGCTHLRRPLYLHSLVLNLCLLLYIVWESHCCRSDAKLISYVLCIVYIYYCMCFFEWTSDNKSTSLSYMLTCMVRLWFFKALLKQMPLWGHFLLLFYKTDKFILLDTINSYRYVKWHMQYLHLLKVSLQRHTKMYKYSY